MKATTNASLENIHFRYRQVKCKICYGTGIDETDSLIGVRCEKCGGTGRRLFPDGPKETRPSCQGRGKNYYFARNGKVCEECDGFGEIRVL